MIGPFHFYSFFFLMQSMVSNSYLFYALPFLELYPEYICPEDMPNCDYKDKCRNPGVIKVNWESPHSLYNWVDRLNLECKI